ncbi:MAG: tRNA uracil 4-sulfurtransferase ThiI [Actinomycetota bacterium]
MAKAFDLVVAHYREVGLKGKNRSYFERTLANNVKTTLTGIPGAGVMPFSGRILVQTGSPEAMDEVVSRLGRVFGISGFSPAVEIMKPSMEKLAAAAIDLAGNSRFESFRVRARRGNTSFQQNSGEINIAVGQALKDHTGARVDLSEAEWTCHIEMAGDKAYLYSEKWPGPGGLPLGCSGKVVCLLSGGIDSPVAAWQIAKRGAATDFVHFSGQPYSDLSSTQQAMRLARHLMPWMLRSQYWLIPFGDIQSEIVTVSPERLRIVLYRRMMMRIAQAVALKRGAEALVTGESLGQVASQTLTNMAAIDSVVHLPVLRPLAGHDKLEIEQIARRIGTYEISIEPHQDCCVLFVPRQVTTAARQQDLEKAEESLDIQALIEKALANAEVTDLRYAN